MQWAPPFIGLSLWDQHKRESYYNQMHHNIGCGEKNKNLVNYY